MTRAYATAAGDEFRLSLTRLAALAVAAPFRRKPGRRRPLTVASGTRGVRTP